MYSYTDPYCWVQLHASHIKFRIEVEFQNFLNRFIIEITTNQSRETHTPVPGLFRNRAGNEVGGKENLWGSLHPQSLYVLSFLITGIYLPLLPMLYKGILYPHILWRGGGVGQGLTPLHLILKTVDSTKFNFDKQSGLPLKGKIVWGYLSGKVEVLGFHGRWFTWGCLSGKLCSKNDRKCSKF